MSTTMPAKPIQDQSHKAQLANNAVARQSLTYIDEFDELTEWIRRVYMGDIEQYINQKLNQMASDLAQMLTSQYQITLPANLIKIRLRNLLSEHERAMLDVDMGKALYEGASRANVSRAANKLPSNLTRQHPDIYKIAEAYQKAADTGKFTTVTIRNGQTIIITGGQS